MSLVQVSIAQNAILAIVGGGGGGEKVTLDVGKSIGAVIGKGGSTIKSIQAESGARLDIEKDSTECTISGTPEQIATAKVLIKEAIDGPKPEAVVNIDVGNKGGAVIGAGGQNIRKLQQESGARVEVESGTGNVTISGTKAAVAKCQELLADILDPKYDAKDFLDVGVSGVPVVVGKGGATIKRLQSESGAKIDIGRGTSVCEIYGTEAAVAKAKKAVEALLADSNYKETVECSIGAIGAVIGKGGETIRSIQESSGARLKVERSPPCVELVGSKETVAKARKLVEEILAKESSGPALEKGHIQQSVPLPKFAIGSIIGKGGSAIQRLQDDSGARVDIQRDSDSARVSGPKEAVAKAVESIEKVVEEQTKLQEKKEAAAKAAGAAEPAAEAEGGDGWGENGAQGDW